MSLFLSRGGYYFYLLQEDARAAIEKNVGGEDFSVSIYTKISEIPVAVRGIVFSRGIFHIMAWRLLSTRAFLVCIKSKDGDLAAYGWVQSWKQFRLRFRCIAQNGYILGPCVTMPNWRRKGLYLEVLRQSVVRTINSSPVFIFCEADNVPSAKGIEKAGFTYIGYLHETRMVKIFNRARWYPA